VNGDRLDYRLFDDAYHPRQSRAENIDFDTGKPTAQQRRVQKLFVLFQMTYLGAPMIYYGDEAGMWGANDPCCRKPMLWHDLNYADETLQADGSRRAVPDAVAFDADLFAHYKRLIAVRQALPALREGSYQTLLVDDDRDVIAFARRSATQKVIVAVNRSAMAQSVNLGIAGGASWIDVLDDTRVHSAQNGLVLELAALSGAVLLRDTGR
jgi:glycosidase